MTIYNWSIIYLALGGVFGLITMHLCNKAKCEKIIDDRIGGLLNPIVVKRILIVFSILLWPLLLIGVIRIFVIVSQIVDEEDEDHSVK